jgi:hypothetical protein
MATYLYLLWSSVQPPVIENNTRGLCYKSRYHGQMRGSKRI